MTMAIAPLCLLYLFTRDDGRLTIAGPLRSFGASGVAMGNWIARGKGHVDGLVVLLVFGLTHVHLLRDQCEPSRTSSSSRDGSPDFRGYSFARLSPNGKLPKDDGRLAGGPAGR